MSDARIAVLPPPISVTVIKCETCGLWDHLIEGDDTVKCAICGRVLMETVRL